MDIHEIATLAPICHLKLINTGSYWHQAAGLMNVGCGCPANASHSSYPRTSTQPARLRIHYPSIIKTFDVVDDGNRTVIMSRRTTATRNYGKKSTRTKAERLFSELPQSPLRRRHNNYTTEILADSVAERIATIRLVDTVKTPSKREEQKENIEITKADSDGSVCEEVAEAHSAQATLGDDVKTGVDSELEIARDGTGVLETSLEPLAQLNTLTWEDVCSPGNKIIKIAEASYAEVYRIINDRGTSIIKTIRLQSPIKPQTKAQIKSGLVDEEPHSQDDVAGELQVSEWLADIPGFVVYKERYIVRGKATRQLLETHQAFQKRMKRQDPGRAQFYPSPSRYLDDTKFLVVELGDAGQALEDWELTQESQLWDIFLLEALALARAEDAAMFEHRDLHEGNLCVRQATPPKKWASSDDGFFGYSGVEITILDYGLSRAEDLSIDDAKPIAHDLEKDLSLFTSTHAPQCEVYRQMRSFILRADREWLPPEAHNTPYAEGIDGPMSWEIYEPYTNVLWLAYLYQYLTDNFVGDAKELEHFREETRELWTHLNPAAKSDIQCFGCAEEILVFAVEAGWMRADQVMELGTSMLDKEDSIILSKDECGGDASLRRSPRRQR
jgi:serine/threonine-protein kinase haspin